MKKLNLYMALSLVMLGGSQVASATNYSYSVNYEIKEGDLPSQHEILCGFQEGINQRSISSDTIASAIKTLASKIGSRDSGQTLTVSCGNDPHVTFDNSTYTVKNPTIKSINLHLSALAKGGSAEASDCVVGGKGYQGRKHDQTRSCAELLVPHNYEMVYFVGEKTGCKTTIEQRSSLEKNGLDEAIAIVKSGIGNILDQNKTFTYEVDGYDGDVEVKSITLATPQIKSARLGFYVGNSSLWTVCDEGNSNNQIPDCSLLY